jgi:hypothetical protein
MLRLMVLVLLAVTLLGNKKPTNVPKYKVGQCLYLFDPESKSGNKDDLLKITAVKNTKYSYIWYTIWSGWSKDVHTMEVEVLERITKKRGCK